MKKRLTIAAAKSARMATRLLGRGTGSALPGYVAERLDGHILAKLGRELPQGSVLVTGTNGKTTTTKLLREMVDTLGIRVINNRAGSNLYRGIVSTLIAATDWRARVRGDIGIFEVDEAAMVEVAPALQPKLIVVLNLFRDQLDRYGELDTTAKLIGKAIASTQAEVWLNADDPLVASLASYCSDPARVHYFGVEAAYRSKLAHDYTADSIHDPASGELLEYSQVFYGHLGHYSSKATKRPTPAVALTQYTPHDLASTLKLRLAGGEGLEVSLALPGLYNAYNALAAVALSQVLGVNSARMSQVLSVTNPAFGRVEKLHLAGREVRLLLIKNPTGFNQIIETFLLQKIQQKVLIIINDNFADGRDVSWLWDVAIEDLASLNHEIYLSGVRRYDMALRLKYANMPVAGIDATPADVLQRLVHQETKPGEVIYVLPTYTALLELRSGLEKMGKLAPPGEDV